MTKNIDGTISPSMSSVVVHVLPMEYQHALIFVDNTRVL
jgi:hypothetical protein